MKISGMIMNQAFRFVRRQNFCVKNALLIVAALIFTLEFAAATDSKAPHQIVDSAPVLASTGEHFLYSSIIQAYKSKRLKELERARTLMLKGYPKSIYSDNALYLEASLSLEKGQFQHALDSLAELEKKYPYSNKLPAALFLKASALKSMKRLKESSEAMAKLQLRFPGSLEANKSAQGSAQL